MALSKRKNKNGKSIDNYNTKVEYSLNHLKYFLGFGVIVGSQIYLKERISIPTELLLSVTGLIRWLLRTQEGAVV